MCNLEVNDNGLMVKKLKNLFIIFSWYTNFSFYPLVILKNEAVGILSVITLAILCLLLVASFVITVVKYNGALFGDKIKDFVDRRFMINLFLLVAMFIYQRWFCPKDYQVILAFVSLTILLINSVLFIFDNSNGNKKQNEWL